MQKKIRLFFRRGIDFSSVFAFRLFVALPSVEPSKNRSQSDTINKLVKKTKTQSYKTLGAYL